MLCKTIFNHIYIEVPDYDKTLLNHYRLLAFSNPPYTDNTHFNEFSRHELHELLKKCDYKITDEEYRFGFIRLWCKPN